MVVAHPVNMPLDDCTGQCNTVTKDSPGLLPGKSTCILNRGVSGKLDCHVAATNRALDEYWMLMTLRSSLPYMGTVGADGQLKEPLKVPLDLFHLHPDWCSCSCLTQGSG